MRLFHRQHGVITILLTIILVPVLTANSVLVEMIRYRSVSQMLDMIAGNAVLSAMADYNEDLYKNFGLLALDGAHEGDVEFWVKENVNGSGNSFSRVVDASSLSVQTTGLYSLNDVNVLKNQIMETEKLSGPFNLAENIAESVLGYDDLFKELGKKLKKAIPGMGLMKDIGETADSMGDAANKGLTYADQYKEWNAAKSKYEEAHQAYISAVNNILDDYESEYPDGQTNPDELQGRQAELADAEEKYLKAIDALVAEGETLADNAKDFWQQCRDSVSKITETVTNQTLENKKQELSGQKKEDIDSVKGDSSLSDDQKKEKIKEIKDEYRGLENAAEIDCNSVQSTVNVYKEIGDSVSEIDVETIQSNLRSQSEALKEEIIVFDEYGYLLVSEERDKKDEAGQVIKDEDGNTIKVTYYLANAKISEESYHKTVNELTADADNSIFAELNRQLEKDMAAADVSLINMLRMTFALVATFFSSARPYDLAANGELVNSESLPSKTMTDMVYGFAAGDEVRVNEALDSLRETAVWLGYDINKLYPANRGQASERGLEIAERIDRMIGTLQWLVDYARDIASILRGNVLGFLRALANIGNLFAKIKQFADDAVYLASHMGETLETAMTFMYEGAMLNGYVIDHFTSRYDITAANRVNGLEGYNSTCFKFAKAEYVLAGDIRETENQKNMTYSLYIIRVLLNIAPVMSSTYVSSLASKAGPFCWVVYIAAIALETVLDVAALQGFQIKLPIYKTKIFCSSETMEKISTELPGVIAGKKLEDPDKDIGILTGVVKGVVDKLYKKDKFKFNYEDYLWLRLCFVPNDVKVKRIADLIYMDMIQEHRGFALSNQFTYLRVEINADHSSVMPLTDALDIAKLKTIKYGGY